MDEQTIGAAVNRTAKLLRRLADRRLAPLGLSSGVLPVLTALIECDGQTQKALTEKAGIEQPTMAATLSRMERDGLIERRPDAIDKRSVRFMLSAATRARLPGVKDAIRAFSAEAVADLEPVEEATLRVALAKMSVRIEAALGEP